MMKNLKNYIVETELKRDDYFILYQGYRESDNKQVIIRVLGPLLATEPFFRNRLRHIARQTAQLEHPNIIPTYGAEQEENILYQVQDFIKARSLEEIIEAEGPFSPERMQHIAAQIASALDYAHQKSVRHGDLSARQIYLDPHDHVWIAHFGLTQIIRETDFSTQSEAISSPEIIAPERIHGQGSSRPADLYALGILCYQMLAKRPPFTGPVATVLHAQAYRQPPLLHKVNPSIPLAVSETVARMLAKGVDLRYNTGAEFARAVAVACREQKHYSYERLEPIYVRERRKFSSSKTLFYFTTALIMMLFIMSLSIWAGYELGIEFSAEKSISRKVVVIPTLSTPTPVTIVQQEDSAPIPARGISVTPADSDSLLPSQAVSPTASLTSMPTLTVTPVPPTPTSDISVSFVVQPTLTATPSHQETLFIFYNPTGFDLIVDISGPMSISELITPGSQYEFSLETGEYQYIVHTVTGSELPTKVGLFQLSPGQSQTITKDYYSEDLKIVQ